MMAIYIIMMSEEKNPLWNSLNDTGNMYSINALNWPSTLPLIFLCDSENILEIQASVR